jgi:hypothetical protein
MGDGGADRALAEVDPVTVARQQWRRAAETPQSCSLKFPTS